MDSRARRFGLLAISNPKWCLVTASGIGCGADVDGWYFLREICFLGEKNGICTRIYHLPFETVATCDIKYCLVRDHMHTDVCLLYQNKKGNGSCITFRFVGIYAAVLIVQPVSVTLLATAKSAHFMASKITAILCIVLMWIVTGVIAYVGFKRIELHPNKKGGTNLE